MCHVQTTSVHSNAARDLQAIYIDLHATTDSETTVAHVKTSVGDGQAVSHSESVGIDGHTTAVHFNTTHIHSQATAVNHQRTIVHVDIAVAAQCEHRAVVIRRFDVIEVTTGRIGSGKVKDSASERSPSRLNFEYICGQSHTA